MTDEADKAGNRRPGIEEDREEERSAGEMRPKALKRRRESLGLTQDELAERLGVETDTLSAWERGDGRPEAEGMLGLAMDQLDLLCAMDLDPVIGQIEMRIDILKGLRSELARIDRAAKKGARAK